MRVRLRAGVFKIITPRVYFHTRGYNSISLPDKAVDAGVSVVETSKAVVDEVIERIEVRLLKSVLHEGHVGILTETIIVAVVNYEKAKDLLASCFMDRQQPDPKEILFVWSSYTYLHRS